MPASTKHAMFDLRAGECLALGGIVLVEIIEKSGRIARLRVTAPREVRIEKTWVGREQSRANHDILTPA